MPHNPVKMILIFTGMEKHTPTISRVRYIKRKCIVCKAMVPQIWFYVFTREY